MYKISFKESKGKKEVHVARTSSLDAALNLYFSLRKEEYIVKFQEEKDEPVHQQDD